MTRCFAFNTPHHKNEQAGKILEINLQVKRFGATETAEAENLLQADAAKEDKNCIFT